MGNLYNDIGDKLTIVNMKKPDERCEINFSRRGWFSSQKNVLNGTVFRWSEEKQKTLAKYYEITGNWHKDITLKNLNTNEKEVVFSKKPYPSNQDWMYGYDTFHCQANYFPKRMHDVIAPTDTRRRPDQRALENGDLE